MQNLIEAPLTKKKKKKKSVQHIQHMLAVATKITDI